MSFLPWCSRGPFQSTTGHVSSLSTVVPWSADRHCARVCDHWVHVMCSASLPPMSHRKDTRAGRKRWPPPGRFSAEICVSSVEEIHKRLEMVWSVHSKCSKKTFWNAAAVKLEKIDWTLCILWSQKKRSRKKPSKTNFKLQLQHDSVLNYKSEKGGKGITSMVIGYRPIVSFTKIHLRVYFGRVWVVRL